MRILLFLALAAALALAARATAADPKDTGKEPLKPGVEQLLGTWVVVSGEEDGKPAPEERIKGSKMTVDKKSIKLTDKDDKQLWVIDYKLDNAKTPHQITMTVSEGQGAGKTSDGIYALDGDTLKICYAVAGAERPKDFTTREGTKENCFVLKRVNSGK